MVSPRVGQAQILDHERAGKQERQSRDDDERSHQRHEGAAGRAERRDSSDGETLCDLLRATHSDRCQTPGDRRRLHGHLRQPQAGRDLSGRPGKSINVPRDVCHASAAPGGDERAGEEDDAQNQRTHAARNAHPGTQRDQDVDPRHHEQHEDPQGDHPENSLHRGHARAASGKGLQSGQEPVSGSRVPRRETHWRRATGHQTSPPRLRITQAAARKNASIRRISDRSQAGVR